VSRRPVLLLSLVAGLALGCGDKDDESSLDDADWSEDSEATDGSATDAVVTPG
jgi:hypothetical protein